MDNVPVSADELAPTPQFQRATVRMNKEGYVIVNDVQLELVLPARGEDKLLTIILCKGDDREEMARRFYRLKGFDAVEETYLRRLKELEDTQR